MLASGDRSANIRIDEFWKATINKDHAHREADMSGNTVSAWPRHGGLANGADTSSSFLPTIRIDSGADRPIARGDSSQRAVHRHFGPVRPPSHHGLHPSDNSPTLCLSGRCQLSFPPAPIRKMCSTRSPINDSRSMDLPSADLDRIRGHMAHQRIASKIQKRSPDITENQAAYRFDCGEMNIGEQHHQAY